MIITAKFIGGIIAVAVVLACIDVALLYLKRWLDSRGLE